MKTTHQKNYQKQKKKKQEKQEFCHIWERLCNIFPNQLPPVNSYVDVDSDGECTEALAELSEAEIVDHVLNRNQTRWK